MNSFNKILAKHSFIFLSLILVGTLGFSNNALAAGSSSTQFAGKIMQTTTPPITCTSQYGVMFVQPKGGSKTPGPFIIESTSKSVNQNGQILGRYDNQMDTQTCYIQAGPYRIPVPVYKIKTKVFNTSKR